VFVIPRSKEQNEAMRAATRVKIHSAAVKLFAEKGFASTGVQEISDLAGISVGLLYRHYKTKDEVFGALVGEALIGLDEVMQLFDSDMPPINLINSFADEIISDLNNNEEFLQFVMLLTQPFMTNRDEPWMQRLREYNEAVYEKLALLIERGQASGQFRQGDSRQMAQHFFSVVQGIFSMKSFLRNIFVPPTSQMLTAYIIRED
jgi:AcrR family transcriptional regulator